MGRPGVIVHGVQPRRGGLAEPSQAQLEAGPETWSRSAQAHPTWQVAAAAATTTTTTGAGTERRPAPTPRL
jgi:hypothetical protein